MKQGKRRRDTEGARRKGKRERSTLGFKRQERETETQREREREKMIGDRDRQDRQGHRGGKEMNRTDGDTEVERER